MYSLAIRPYTHVNKVLNADHILQHNSSNNSVDSWRHMNQQDILN